MAPVFPNLPLVPCAHQTRWARLLVPTWEALVLMRLLTGPNASGIGASTYVFYDTYVSMNVARRGWSGRLTVLSLARWSRLTRTIACAASCGLCVLELYGGWTG
jgi:hypothetical protein